MKTLPTTFLAALIAIFGVLAVPGTSHASTCTGSNRLSLDAAACLDGGTSSDCSWKLFGTCMSVFYTAWVQSKCSGDGTKVVAKIDVEGHQDYTWHQTNNGKRTLESFSKIRGAYCCDDLGKCN